MKKSILLGLILASALSLGACSNNKEDATQGSAKLRASSKSEESSTLTQEEKIPTVNRAEYTVSFSEDWQGLKTSISKVIIAELSKSEMENQKLENKYVAQVYFKIENTSDKDFNVYPDQGTLVIEGQQIDADMWFSDDLGGEILHGVTKEGLVTFSIPKISNVDNVPNIRLIWRANFDTDNYNEESSKDFDVSFDLTK
ncbi:hypothetical protein [Enterococcus faecalis]|uniref:hypothetical protein n=1 Tax=Enterococcus faecalis TaxID=1351 RepID=UPI0003EA381F|nr:hypothetical protein [Enterococcus faecalis]AHI40555.1 Hypothetical protein DENG_01583 [Enterococcus faecalis DENG1]EGO7724609.1 DUF4352 domain-containing protein [Enterococcus faecalis]EGO7995698.1 DUF4352 domain-containing protein [Enterococcus faecalis]EGO8315889.1 DUF4352 domain-containing protein [Enterococcus faecalis]EGO8415133.1 DUF4352 domain-containing protein [Enterococcus faecalis]